MLLVAECGAPPALGGLHQLITAFEVLQGCAQKARGSSALVAVSGQDCAKVAKVPNPPYMDHFPKSDSALDLQKGSCIGPTGHKILDLRQRETYFVPQIHNLLLCLLRFAAALCGVCPLKAQVSRARRI